jgi:hypothetical protein
MQYNVEVIKDDGSSDFDSVASPTKQDLGRSSEFGDSWYAYSNHGCAEATEDQEFTTE